MGNLSPHFSSHEFECHHCGALKGPSRSLVQLLEKIRALNGRPLRVISGFRCEAHNARVGGAKMSQHLRGTAADIAPGRVSGDQALTLGARGVGTSGQWATHVDVRPGAIARWEY